MKKCFLAICLILVSGILFAQVPTRGQGRVVSDELQSIFKNNVNTDVNSNQSQQENTSKPRKDTIAFEHRNDLKDSISISFKYLDATKRNYLDSSYNDFDNYYSVPSHYLYIGNNGAAATSLIYKPNLLIGFDPGFHAFDIYKYTFEGTKFYKTSRPFTALSYQLASGKEQMLKASHTQNPSPNLNWGFDYKLISSPGYFVTQNTNHNSYRVFGEYQGKKKRYNLSWIFLGNNIRASENGGVKNEDDLSDPNRKNRFSVPVNLGNKASYQSNPFVTTVSTGNNYKDVSLFLRQSYDLGKKDSIVINDTTTEYLFYPKLRLQYTFTASNQSYQYKDIVPDSTLYSKWYGLTLNGLKDTVEVFQKWKIISNDFSLMQFPDTKNQAQFFLAGLSSQHISGEQKNEKKQFYNLFVHGEYRNRTRNKLWDILLKGQYYFKGLNEGDYEATAVLNRYFNKRWGNVKLFFNNVNRTPSFIFNAESNFNFQQNELYKKENITSFGVQSTNKFVSIEFKNNLIFNHCYFSDYYQTTQSTAPINLIQVSLSKKIKLTKRWNWYVDATIQQTDGASPIRVPLFFTRNRIAYEGVFFKNLNLSTGIDARYYSPYKAYGYSPLMGQFFTQDSSIIKNLPDLSLFMDFRIKGFTAYIRTENLNTANLSNGFGFTKNNFAAPLYPTQGFVIRFGIQWWFVN